MSSIRNRKHHGGPKEDALAALDAAGETTRSVSIQSYGKEIPIGGFTFKLKTGFYQSELLAKPDTEPDSTYIVIDVNSIGSQ